MRFGKFLPIESASRKPGEWEASAVDDDSRLIEQDASNCNVVDIIEEENGEANGTSLPGFEEPYASSPTKGDAVDETADLSTSRNDDEDDSFNVEDEDNPKPTASPRSRMFTTGKFRLRKHNESSPASSPRRWTQKLGLDRRFRKISVQNKDGFWSQPTENELTETITLPELAPTVANIDELALPSGSTEQEDRENSSVYSDSSVMNSDNGGACADEPSNLSSTSIDEDLLVDGIMYSSESNQERDKLLNETIDVESTPTSTVRVALHRLGRLKKKVTEKLKRPEPTTETLIEQEGDTKIKTTFAEKITKLASHSAKSMQTNSPLPLRRRMKLDDDEEVDSSSTDALHDEANEWPSPPMLDNSFSASWSSGPASSVAEDNDNNKRCTHEDSGSESSDDLSVNFPGVALGSTIWVRSTSDCQHLEIHLG